jgi:hypothetical protein
MKGFYVLRKVLTTVAATSVALIVAAPVASASAAHKWGPVKRAGVSASGTWQKDAKKGKYYAHVHGTVYDTANDKKSAYANYMAYYRYTPGSVNGRVTAPGGKGKHKSWDLYGNIDRVLVQTCVDNTWTWEKCTGWKTIYKR